MDSSSEQKKEEPKSPLKKIYFNMYVAGIIRNRPDMEAINTDLLYFCLLMKMNQYAKEVYFLRRSGVNAAVKDAAGVAKHLRILRDFVLTFYEIPTPRWNLIQDEELDPLEELDKLDLQEDPFGEKTQLGHLAMNRDGKDSASALDELNTSLGELKLDSLEDDEGEMSPRPLTRTPSLVPQDDHQSL
jgi:hypothetical protein